MKYMQQHRLCHYDTRLAIYNVFLVGPMSLSKARYDTSRLPSADRPTLTFANKTMKMLMPIKMPRGSVNDPGQL